MAKINLSDTMLNGSRKEKYWSRSAKHRTDHLYASSCILLARLALFFKVWNLETNREKLDHWIATWRVLFGRAYFGICYCIHVIWLVSMFDWTGWTGCTKMNYFAHGQTAVCNVCKSKERDLLQRLQGSNKRRCKCPGAMNNIHEDNCFMSWQGVGPRPFYGSDVLKRHEAEWLEKKNQLKKRRKE